MINDINKAFSHILYRDIDHSYFNTKTNQELVPVTTYKKQFQNEFKNKEYWLKKKATEAGLTPEQMQDTWDCLREVGVKRGSILHDYLELRTWRKIPNLKLDMTGLDVLKRQAEQYLQDYTDTYNVATELVVGNNIIGGQIDRYAERNSKYGIIDYKTDSKTDEQLKASYNKKMLKHLSHLDDSIISGYFVQVNLYRQLLQEQGFPVDFMEIVHFSIHENNYKIYEVPIIDVL